jgi:putative cardiolipin synthase
MHNKSFTVDGQVTVVGGRNIADEYFGARADARFADLDVLAVGPVVGDVSGMFDRYWNHETALPVPAFTRMPADPAAALSGLRGLVSDWEREILASPYADALRRNVTAMLETAPGGLSWAPYTLVYDSPDKGVPSRAGDAPLITAPLADAFRTAAERVLIVSPYFVPRRSGVDALAAMEARGIEVTVVTNSLAANNQFAVHAGYAPTRKPLLEAGVEIYEVRPDADVAGAELIGASGAKATLHTKAFVIDRRRAFIGSFNFDPRSANLNTESGVIIDSPAIAADMLGAVAAAAPEQAYAVFLDDRGRLRWRGQRGGVEKVWEHEPETSWWARTVAGFLRLLPIRSQL